MEKQDMLNILKEQQSKKEKEKRNTFFQYAEKQIRIDKERNLEQEK